MFGSLHTAHLTDFCALFDALGYEFTRDNNRMGATRPIFTKTYPHFATNGAIGFTFVLHTVKIRHKTQKNETERILAWETRRDTVADQYGQAR
jgi:hypothetical protein